MSAARDDITKLLREWTSGSEEALHALIPLVHKELRRTARAYLAREWDANSWQPTQLVNEAFLRLVECRQLTWQDRSHFFRLAAKKMREILIDYARKKRLQKKGGANVRVVPLEDAVHVGEGGKNTVDLLVLNTALEDLERLDTRKSQVVEMRFFAGLTIEEIADALGISVATVHRELHLAKVWLYRAIYGGQADES